MGISQDVQEFLRGRGPDGREASFDYCFNYFQSAFDEHRLEGLLASGQLEISCLQLGFYLASWGMFRGKSRLLQQSSHFYNEAVHAIVEADPLLWKLDLGGYNSDTCDLLMRERDRIKDALFPSASNILVTKVMLGVFGCVPAFDTYFVEGFGHYLSKDSLMELGRQYQEEDKPEIDCNRPQTLKFETGAPTDRLYTAAKVVDMHYFMVGRRAAAER